MPLSHPPGLDLLLGRAPSSYALLHAAVASGPGRARASLPGKWGPGKVQYEEEEAEKREIQVSPACAISPSPLLASLHAWLSAPHSIS